METSSERESRRVFLIASLSVGVAWAAALVTGARGATACGGDGAVTPPQTEGPYFKPNSPARASLIEPGMPGTRLVVEGSVLTADCKPVPAREVARLCWRRGRSTPAGFCTTKLMSLAGRRNS